MANHGRDAAKERFWRDSLRRQAASGLSVRAFCRQERLSEPSFYAWRRTLAERRLAASPAAANPAAFSRAAPGKRRTLAEPPAFLPVIVNDHDRSSGAILLELAGGRVLRLPEAIVAERLTEIVLALEARAER